MVTKRIHRSKRSRRYYGMVKVREGEKSCWMSVQNKNGWSLGLALGKRTIWLRNIRFKNHKEVQDTVKRNIVFVHLKNDK